MSEYVVSINMESYVLRGTFDIDLREPIVRCRDCVHWRPPDKMHQSRCDGVFVFVKPTPDGFCAWGVRRES